MIRSKIYKSAFITSFLLGAIGVAIAQDPPVFHNAGLIFVSPDTEVLTKGVFQNSKVGTFNNNGAVYFLNDFKNEGDFIFSDALKSGKVFFKQFDGGKDKLTIYAGDLYTSFRDVNFDTKEVDLQKDISIAGAATFENGNVVVSGAVESSITFLDGSSIEGASDKSHIVGRADRAGKKAIILPVGDNQYHRPIALGISKEGEELFGATYKKENPLEGRPLAAKGPIVAVDNAEYWEVFNEVKDGHIILSLSLDDRTTPKSFLESTGDKKVHIVRWDEKEKIWVDESGQVDPSVGSNMISTPLEVSAKGIFTFGLVDEKYNDEVIIYNLVTPNGDGMNDYFIIENLFRYPNNSVQIVNRWGAKVFDTSNYDPNGDGSENVFTGYATGKGVVGKGKLPSGTYYYILRYEVKRDGGSEWIKKAGYLHLDTN